jgi:hypothetical protein
MKINLFYLGEKKYGGWPVYTSHLFRALESSGHDVRLYHVGDKSDKPERRREFGYGCKYRRLSIDDGVAEVYDSPSLITAADHTQYANATHLLRAGAAITVHDPAELSTHSSMRQLVAMAGTVIGIRPAILNFIKRAIVIPHPYIPSGERTAPWAERAGAAISTSRICFDKHTDWLLEANRHLTDGLRICIKGFETRSYGRMNLLPKFPEYKQSKGHFDRMDPYAAVKLCSGYWYLTDMSAIKGDGGGTQYTFLEAMDAGTVVVVNKEWLRPGGEMQDGVNCLAVDGPAALVELIKSTKKDLKRAAAVAARLQKGARAVLAAHAARRIVPMYITALTNLAKPLTLV